MKDIDPEDTPYLWQKAELEDRLTRLQTWEGYTRQCIYIGCYPIRHANSTREHDFRLPGLLDAAQARLSIISLYFCQSALLHNHASKPISFCFTVHYFDKILIERRNPFTSSSPHRCLVRWTCPPQALAVT